MAVPSDPELLQVSNDDLTLAFVRSYIDQHGYPPSYREIMEAVPGVTATSTVSRILYRLKTKGAIDFKPGYPRTLRLLRSTAEKEVNTVD